MIACFLMICGNCSQDKHKSVVVSVLDNYKTPTPRKWFVLS